MSSLLWLALAATPRGYEGPQAVADAQTAVRDDGREDSVPPADAAAAEAELDARIARAVEAALAARDVPRANDSPAAQPTSAGPWVLGGFVDTAYQASLNRPANHVWRGMFSSPRTNELTLNLAALYVRRDPGPRDPFNLELALQAGPAADALVSGEPMPGGVDSRYAGVETWKHIARANAGLTLRSGTDVRAGVFSSPIGVGVFWTPTNWHYTTPWSLNAVPYYLAGGRVAQKVGDAVELQAWVINGWQTFADVNAVPSYMAAVVITPVPDVTIQSLHYFGPEDVDTSVRAWRTFWNNQVVWNTDRVGLSALVDVGRERLTSLPGEPVAIWVALSADVRWRVLGRKHTWDMAARGGAYWDRDGRMFGVSQWLGEAVYTNDVRLFDNVLVRAEYRYDRSTARGGFFYRGDATADTAPGLARDQHTVVVALTGQFELRFPGVKSGP